MNQSKKKRDEFFHVLRTLVHKLSQPLTSLRGSAELVLMGETQKADLRQVLERSLDESRRMTEILKTLRDVLEMEGTEENVRPVSWRQSVEKTLEETVSSREDGRLRLICDVAGEVWVKANPQHLDLATRRFIGRVMKAQPEGHAARIELSVQGEAACLSICGESTPASTGSAPQKGRTRSSPESPELGDVDWWIVRRAIERQGGRLTISAVSETSRCYQINLPLELSMIAKPQTFQC